MTLLDGAATKTTELSSLLDLGTGTSGPGPDLAGARESEPRPGLVERATVVVTVFVLIHGLPIDWFKDRSAHLAEEGNLKMVVAQLVLMSLGIARVAGRFNWLIRVFQLDLTVLGLAGLAMASTLWSDAPFETFKQATVLLFVTIFAGYLVLRFSLEEILELMARVFVVSAIANLFFVFALPAYAMDTIAGEVAWDGVFFHKNSLGFVSLLSLPILIVVGRSGPPWRHLYYLFVPAQIVLLLGSQSKTMLVATGGSLLVLFIGRAFRGRRTLKGAVIVALVVFSITMVAVATANLAVLADWLDKDVTLTGRVPLWQGLIPIAMEQPIFGYGYKAAFRGYFSPVHEVWVSEGWEPSSAHNALLHIWLELGVAGVYLYAFGVTRAAYRAVSAASSAVNAVGLWPLAFISAVLLLSITESGIVNSVEAWMLFPIASFSSALYAKRRTPAPMSAPMNTQVHSLNP